MAHSDTTIDGSVQAHALNPTASPSLEEYFHQRLEHVRRHLPEASRQLKGIGIVRVEVYYDGCGDSGQIESIHYFDVNYKAVDPAGRTTIDDDALMELFYDLIEVRHAGWENNDGAFGEINWDLITDALKHKHNERYLECETTEHDGL